MPKVDSSGPDYRILDFLGFHDYRVGDDGSVWTKRRRGSAKVDDELIPVLREKYATGKYTCRQLGSEFGCSRNTIQALVSGHERSPKVWRKMQPGIERRGGYLRVILCCHEFKHRYMVHQLVLLAFVGSCPSGMEACHFPDKDPSNCRLSNLRWGTKSDNYQDKIVHGTHYIGKQNPNAKLVDEDVLEIRRMHSLRVSVRKIASTFDVSIPNVEAIIYRRTWNNLP